MSSSSSGSSGPRPSMSCDQFAGELALLAAVELDAPLVGDLGDQPLDVALQPLRRGIGERRRIEPRQAGHAQFGGPARLARTAWSVSRHFVAGAAAACRCGLAAADRRPNVGLEFADGAHLASCRRRRAGLRRLGPLREDFAARPAIAVWNGPRRLTAGWPRVAAACSGLGSYGMTTSTSGRAPPRSACV